VGHPAVVRFCQRGKFRVLHISLRISSVMIPRSMSAENRGGWNESHEQSFREMQ